MKKQKSLTNKGFSMIELIIVIAIMAILIAVLGPVLTKYIGSAQNSSDKQLIDTIATAMETSCIDPEVLEAGAPTNISSFNLLSLKVDEAPYKDNPEYWNNVLEILDCTTAGAPAFDKVAALLKEVKTNEAAMIMVSLSGNTAVVTINKDASTVLVKLD